MIVKKTFALILLFAMVACTKFTLSKTEGNFPDNRWERENIQTFEFEVKEDMDADIAILFSHIDAPQYDKVPLEITIQNPAGEKETIAVMLRLKNEAGEELSDCVGDVCDLETVIREATPMKKGTYVFKLQNAFAKYKFTPNVLAVGVSIENISH